MYTIEVNNNTINVQLSQSNKCVPRNKIYHYILKTI